MNYPYLAIDIETIPCSDVPPECLPKWEEPAPFDPDSVKVGNLKDADKIASKIEAERAKYETDVAKAKAEWEAGYTKQCSLDPDLCQVACIGVHLDNESFVICNVDDEKNTVTRAWDLIANSHRVGLNLVTYNGIGFDLPVLRRRAMLLGIPVSARMYNDLTKRFGNDRHHDLYQILTDFNPGRWKGKTLDFFLRRFGVGCKTDGMDGSKVAATWSAGEYLKVIDYCRNDVAQLAALYTKIAPWIA